jgi:hypothetical protein
LGFALSAGRDIIRTGNTALHQGRLEAGMPKYPARRLGGVVIT